MIYVASGRDRGKFVHLGPSGQTVVVEQPNAYTGLALEERSVLLKIHGHVDHGATRELENSPSAKTITSTTSPASRPPGPSRCSSRPACGAATYSSSATRSTIGACVSSCAASGATTGSHTDRGPCIVGRVACARALARARSRRLRRRARRLAEELARVTAELAALDAAV